MVSKKWFQGWIWKFNYLKEVKCENLFLYVESWERAKAIELQNLADVEPWVVELKLKEGVEDETIHLLGLNYDFQGLRVRLEYGDQDVLDYSWGFIALEILTVPLKLLRFKI